jgi:ABC-2 type transport system permease protein
MTGPIGTQTSMPETHRASLEAPPRGLTFSGILRSEWIKLRSLRSTVWSFSIMVVLQIGLGILVAGTMQAFNDAPAGMEGAFASADAEMVVTVAIAGLALGQLIIAVLGVLIISGEYSTGQIRSSLTAVPKRLPVLWAKAIVFAIVTFVVSLVSLLVTYAVTAPILAGVGIEASLLDEAVWPRLVGAAAYLSFIGVISLGIGAIVRSTAGGIASSLGLLLVLPVVLLIIPLDWVRGLGDWLPSAVGGQLYFDLGVFETWQAQLIVLGWVALFLGIAALLLKRRDA